MDRGATTDDDTSPTAGGGQDVLIRCSDLTHRYQRGRSRSRLLWWRDGTSAPSVTAIDGVSMSVAAGETVGVAGPSGSGKSTLLHLIAGLLTPTAGTVSVVGQELTDRSASERTRVRREHVGLVFQRFHLLPSLTARENVALPLLQFGVPRGERRDRAVELLDRVGLGDRVDHVPGELSGGEQQRVAIARALVTDPAVLLADEPTGELDSDTGERVLDVMGELAAERAVVIASHDRTALDATDRALELHDGRIVSDAAP